MSNFIFKKVSKTEAKLKLALMGVAGSGKTYSSLLLATALSNKVAVIDTERSVSKYADKFPSVDVLDWDITSPDNQIKNLIEAILMAEKTGYEVLVIDSLSFWWDWLLTYVEQIQKIKGNSFTAWGQATPLQKKLIYTILNSPLHIISTMRVKTEYVIDSNNGKMQITRAGVGASQGKDIEYEFDMLGILGENHILEVKKDRFGFFQDRIVKFDLNFIKEIKEWLQKTNNGGKEEVDIKKEFENVLEQVSKLNITKEDKQRLKEFGEKLESMTKEDIKKVKDYFKKHYKGGG